MSTKKWKRMKDLKKVRVLHAIACVQQELLIFGGKFKSTEYSDRVDVVNVEQEHGEWQQAPPMPSIVACPK